MSSNYGNPDVDTHAMELPEDLLSRRDLSTGEKVTLTYLYRRAQRAQLEAWPRNRTLADATGQTIPTVQRHLFRLERIGLIERGQNGAGRTIHLLRPTSEMRPPTSPVIPPHLTAEVPPPHQCASLHLRKLPLKLPVSGSTKEAEASAPPLSGDNPAQVRSAPAPRPTPEVETRDGAQQRVALHSTPCLETQQLIEGIDPGDGAQRPPSKRAKWIAKRWTRFCAIHHECQGNMIEAGHLKRHSSFDWTPNLDRMLGRLYREKYTQENLNAAWLEFAGEAERTGDMRYFKPATCFVAANIDRKLQFIAEREAREE